MERGSLFGEARSIVQSKPTTGQWRRLCALVEQVEQGVFEDQWATNLNHHLARWPDALRRAPVHWVDRSIAHDGQATAWLSLARCVIIQCGRRRQLPESVVFDWFERGYWDQWVQVSIVGTALDVAWLDTIWANAPITHLKTSKSGMGWRLCGAIDRHLSQTIEHLTLRSEYLRDEDAGHLTMMPGSSLKSFELPNNALSDSFIEELIDSDYMGALESLDLSENDVPSALCALAHADFPELEEVHLQHTMLDDDMIYADPYIVSGGWRVLDISNNMLSSRGAFEGLNALTILESLEVLDLSHNPMDVSALNFLPQMHWARTLRDVTLVGCPMMDDGAYALAQHAHLFQSLLRLNISLEPLSRQARDVIEHHPHLARALA